MITATVGEPRDDTDATAAPTPLPVYVIHHHAPEWCRETVRSLRASTVPVLVRVVDNGGLGELPDTEVLPQRENLGFAGAANRALAHWLTDTDSEFCVITSHDLAVEPDCLENLLAFARNCPSAGVIGPRLTGTAWARTSTYAPAFSRSSTVTPPDERPALVGARRVAWTSGTCLLLRRRCVMAVGAFDERFGSYCEDVDYGVRANVVGWDVAVVATALGTTNGSADGSSTSLMWRNRALTSAKHLGPLAAARRLASSASWVVRGPLLAVRSPGAASTGLRRCREALPASIAGAAMAARWYAHVFGSRLLQREPTIARCSDTELSRALSGR